MCMYVFTPILAWLNYHDVYVSTIRFTGLTGVVTARVLDKELLLGGYRIPEKV